MIRKLLLAATLLASAPCAVAQTIAITGGKIVTNTSQGVIETGTVVITNGRIVSVGAGGGRFAECAAGCRTSVKLPMMIGVPNGTRVVVRRRRAGHWPNTFFTTN